jgi:uncharacterized membrane protein YfcA
LPDALVPPALVLLGIAVAVYGTIIGAGGGFVLTPLLLLLYPDHEPEVITALSLGVVFFNALSGSVAYARQRRVDHVAVALFAAATLPGAVFGALSTGLFSRDLFEALFGALLVTIAVWLNLRPVARIQTAPPAARFIRRTLTDVRGDTYRYAFDPVFGVVIGLAIGYLSSLFGVGGGIMYVPAMVMAMRFPAFVATATSTTILMFTSGVGALVHVFQGDYAGIVGEELSLAFGVLIGAQIGAWLSARMRSQTLVLRLLSLALLAVAARLIASPLL